MSDEQQPAPTQDVKAEGDNAPINVKVRPYVRVLGLRVVRGPRILAGI
jgi:hypothetical protein